MSYHGRAGDNSNSAVIVTVTPDDFESSHPLAGIAFQRKLESKAYEIGAGKIPVETYGQFKLNMPSMAAEVMPPAYPAPSPHGYSPLKADCPVSSLRIFTGEEVLKAPGMRAALPRRPWTAY